ELSATSRMVPIWIIATPLRLRLGPGQDLFQPPPLQLRQRPRLLDPHAVADLRLVLLVVGVEPARPLDRAGVLRVLHAALDLHDDRLLHLVGDHATDLRLPAAALDGFRPRPDSFNASARRYVFTRARSRRRTRRRLGSSSCPVDFWRRSFQLASRSCFSFSRSSASPCWASVSRSFFFIGSPSRTRASPD